MPLSDPLLEDIKVAYGLISQAEGILGSVRKRFTAFETVKDFVEDAELGPAIIRAKDEVQMTLDLLLQQLAKL